MTTSPPILFALILGAAVAAQEPEPAQPLPTAPSLVPMSAWLGQKLHVREPLAAGANTSDILRPIAVVADLEIDAQGAITVFVLAPLVGNRVGKRVGKEQDEAMRTSLAVKDVAWSAIDKALVTPLAASAVAGLDEWKEPEVPELGRAAVALASQLVATKSLPDIEGTTRLPAEGIWLDPIDKRVLWIAVEVEDFGTRLAPFAAFTLEGAPTFIRLTEPARLHGAPALEQIAAPPSKAVREKATTHFRTSGPATKEKKKENNDKKGTPEVRGEGRI